jgi:hypothetical protein
VMQRAQPARIEPECGGARHGRWMQAAGSARGAVGRKRAVPTRAGRVENGKRSPAAPADAAAEAGAGRLTDGAARRNEEREERRDERHEQGRERPAAGSCAQRRLLTRHDPGF